MSTFHDLLKDSLNVVIDDFGTDDRGRKIFLIIAGKKVPVIQSSLPRDSSDLAAGYAMYGEGQITCRKCDVLEATGGKLPKLESRVQLLIEGESSGQEFTVATVDTSHGDPALRIQLEIN